MARKRPKIKEPNLRVSIKHTRTPIKSKHTRKGGTVRTRKNSSPSKTKNKALTSSDVHLASEIKRINERINQLEKRGYTGTSAYRLIVGAKYGEQNIITEKKGGVKTPTAKSGTIGGGLKIRTDVKAMTPEEKNAIRNLITEFTDNPSTIRELKSKKSEVLEYYKQYGVNKKLKFDDITDEMLQDYLDLEEKITSDAIARAFYLKEQGFSDLYYRSENGEKYSDLKKEVVQALMYLYEQEGFSGDYEPYDEQIIKLFYSED